MEEKNILYLTRSMGLGGTEKVILQLCCSFNTKFNKIIVCSNGGVHEEQLSELNIKHCKIDDIESKDIFTIIKTIFTLAKVIRTEKIDIIHTHHRMAAFYAYILKFLFKFEFVHTSHNTFKDKQYMTRLSLSKAKIIAVGNSVRENLTNVFKLQSRNITTIYNAVELKEFLDETIEEIEYYRKQGYFIVGNIGRLSEQKGMEYYIKSARIIKSKVDKIKFFIIGDGEDKEKLESMITSFNLKDDVKLLGFRSDIQNTIKQLDLVVLSSLWEGLPLTPIEAFSVGKTIVATDVDGTPEIVKNNYNGILVEARDSEKLANAIIYMNDNHEKLIEFNNNAYKTYVENFSYDKFIKKYEDFYNKILE